MRKAGISSWTAIAALLIAAGFLLTGWKIPLEDSINGDYHIYY